MLREKPLIFQVRFFKKILLLYFASDNVSDMSELISLKRKKEPEKEFKILLGVVHQMCL